MKYGPWILFLIIMGLAMVNNPQSTQARSSRLDSLWIQAEKAEKEGLPATADRYYQQIYPLELSNRKWPEALRALTRMITNRSVIEGNRSQTKITLLEEKINQAPTEIRPMLQIILAEWYQQFFRQNRWRFLSRTRTEGITESDILSWDLPRILGQIDQIYRQILNHPDSLRKIPIRDYSGFLDKGDIPDTYRPTLYDFAAFKAIEFYTLAEHETIRPEDSFDLEADSDALSSVSEFIRYRPVSPDSLSSHYKAFRLLQDILTFHASDPSAPAFLDADLQRLQLMKNLCRGENKLQRYLQRLEEIAVRHPQSELSSLARYYWARELTQRGDYYQADQVARIGAQTHPQSRGGINCSALQKEIRFKSFEITTEKIIPPQHPFSLSIQYRNIDSLYLRLYPVSSLELMAQDGNAGMEWIPEEKLKIILQRPPALSKIIPLTPGDSFLTQRLTWPLQGLNPGLYRILISHQSGFTLNHNQIESILIQVSSLSLIQHQGMEHHQGYIVHSRDGYPLPGIPIQYLKYDYSDQRFTRVDSMITDSLGFFRLGIKSDRFSGILIAGDPDRDGLIQNNVHHYIHYPSPHPSIRKVLFYTDRSIYRPGQLIHFKGICIEMNPDRQSYQVIPFLPVTLRLLDVNRQEIGQMELISNDYGSVSGVWTAPADGLTGSMSLTCQSPAGETTIQVEEYKRPSFEIRINPPRDAYRLNDTVTIEGKAETYSGAPLDQASVLFRVTRQTRFPFFRGDYLFPARFPYPGKSTEEIGHGTI
ncbi:MAG: hypothetical protein KBA26_15055, partial [Candidatus Delongbacteria bacterium]|nr:hypothetical protein [Candidatus Delongbacteria bacterium]